MGDFSAQRQSMQVQNQFAIQREGNTWQRMVTTQAYNSWQLGSQIMQSQQQREWTQEDWHHQDTMRGLQNGWNMDDLNEEIRFSSGRQRRQLLRQRDRTALTQNLEGDQIETQRDRQKELWAQEDERFKKQKEYQNQLNQLDVQSFDMNRSQREKLFKMDQDELARKMKEYEEQKKVQDEMQQLQRKYQFDQLQLQKEAAGASAAAAAKQREYADALLSASQNSENFVGSIQQLNNYDRAFAFTQAFQQMAQTLQDTNTTKVDDIIRLIREIATFRPVSNNPYGPE
jgi:hypothetical protein